jgi:hypothetical protein
VNVLKLFLEVSGNFELVWIFFEVQGLLGGFYKVSLVLFCAFSALNCICIKKIRRQLKNTRLTIF